MSCLARSIANSLRIDDDDFQPSSPSHRRRENPPKFEKEETERESTETEGDLRGVKDDLSEFRDSFTRQLWGVANFLAPPALPTNSSQSHNQRLNPESNRSESTDPSISGDEEDEDSVYARISTANCNHSEIGVRNLDKQSLLESYKPSSSLCRLGFHSVQVDDDDDDDGVDVIYQALGLTDEVLTFAGNIGHHPETWLDFPVEDEEDLEDFPMSKAQLRHAQAVEHLTPRLEALRFELCPAHMSVGFFWKVYFVLLHSRLNKQDAELLSTPEVVEARAKWMQEQQKRAKKDSEWFHSGLFSRASDEDCTPRSFQNEHSETLSSWTFASEPTTSSTTVDSDMEKQVNFEPHFMDKYVSDEKPFSEIDDKNVLPPSLSKRTMFSFVVDDNDDSDDWPEDDYIGHSGRLLPVGIADEVSFSDLEDDDCCIPVISKPLHKV